MRCPVCEAVESKVLESRDVGEGNAIRRRRECEACEHRFTTYERIEKRHLVVMKKNGDRQLFDRAKLLRGIERACEKRPVSSLQLEALVERVEQALYATGESEVKSEQIGELVMQELAQLDDVAYIRFASVYRSFSSVASFEQELSRIKQKRRILRPDA
jgi:transcriptional repressor NrdR